MMKKTLYKAYLKKYGLEKQLDMVLEEMSELSKAILKYKRYGGNNSYLWDVAGEQADVEIMLEQLRDMFHKTQRYSQIVDDKKQVKLLRMKERLNENP